MFGLRPACGYQEVAIDYKSLKLIHPGQCFLDGAAEAFIKLQPAYTEWNTARVRQGWIHPTAPSSVPVNSDSWHPNNRPSSHSEGRGGLGACPPLASQSGMPGFPQQRKWRKVLFARVLGLSVINSFCSSENKKISECLLITESPRTCANKK